MSAIARSYVYAPGLLVAALFLSTLRCGGGEVYSSPPTASEPGWNLVWSDEFTGVNGTRPNSSKWQYDIGGNGWGNDELETYTDRIPNVEVHSGNLVITARRETHTGPDGITREYTSGRIKTQELFSQEYGRFEARIKIPKEQGLWPAFWMLGTDLTSIGWPKCGEIDVMENIGKEPTINHGSLHGPSTKTRTSTLTKAFVLPSNQDLSNAFHVYAIEWSPDTVKFFVDSDNYATFTKAEWPEGGTWVFDHPFFLILNVAVGGTWPGAPDATTQFPQQMLVDYVRVYNKS